jgi:DRG Family Regulatory Proteins, Tma46
MEATSACISTLCRLGKTATSAFDQELSTDNRRSFVLKTKEQRAAEKALMDKSPLNTLTLEDFLESQRLNLTGTLTPVTPESFAKWKKERLDKKAAEEEGRKMREATGRAMFEKGDWQFSDDEEDESEDDDTDGVWNLEALREETELARQRREEDRLTSLAGGPLENAMGAGTGPGPGSAIEGSAAGS